MRRVQNDGAGEAPRNGAGAPEASTREQPAPPLPAGERSRRFAAGEEGEARLTLLLRHRLGQQMPLTRPAEPGRPLPPERGRGVGRPFRAVLGDGPEGPSYESKRSRSFAAVSGRSRRAVRRSCRALACLGLLTLLASLLTLSPAAAQGPKQPAPQKIAVAADGTDLFRALLDRRGIKPIKLQDMRTIRRWDDVIVIVIGSTHGGNFGSAMGQVQNAKNNSGAALIASDSYIHLGSVWRANGGFPDSVEIQNARVECRDNNSVHAADIGNGQLEPLPNCPYVVPLSDLGVREAPDPDNPIGRLFAGLTRVATNEPSYIFANTLSGEFRFALAGFPAKSVSVSNRQNLPKNAYFAVGGYGEDWSRYHFLAMADHSVFINQMLIEPGTDNLELAYRTIDYLQGPNKRKRCLFVENGRVVEEFDGLRKAFASQNPIPIPDFAKIQEKLVDLGNMAADRIQTRNIPNTILDRGFGLPRIMWFLLILLSIYVTFHLLRRWSATRKPTDQPPPPTVAGVPAGPPGVFDRRQKELLRRDNVYEPVRDLVREFFVSLGVHGDQGPRHPKLVISDAVRKPESLRQAIRDFWKLAYGPPQEVNVGRWRELEPYFVRLREAHADGKWRFVMPGAPVAATV
jgi:hypothetical protein